MIFYTADLHFGYAKILEDARRPFSSLQQMDEALIENWNAVVSDQDTVYVVGDVDSYCTPFPDRQLGCLRGHKHLIRGNHDNCLKEQQLLLDFFETVTDYLEIDDGDTHIILCHHPLVYMQRSYVVHGHTHNTKLEAYRILQQLPKVLNAGVDINGFCPVTLHQLIENNRAFYQNPPTGQLRPDPKVVSGEPEVGCGVPSIAKVRRKQFLLTKGEVV